VAASAAEVKNGDQDIVSGHDLGDPDLATRGQIDDVKTAKTEHSAKPLKLVPAEHSVRKARRASAKQQPAENKDNVVQLSAQRGAVYEKSKRIKDPLGKFDYYSIPNPGDFAPEDFKHADLAPTPLGLQMYVRCQGSTMSPAEYFGLKYQPPT